MFPLRCREVSLLSESPLQLVSLSFGEEHPSFSFLVSARLALLGVAAIALLLVQVFVVVFARSACLMLGGGVPGQGAVGYRRAGAVRTQLLLMVEA